MKKFLFAFVLLLVVTSTTIIFSKQQFSEQKKFQPLAVIGKSSVMPNTRTSQNRFQTLAGTLPQIKPQICNANEVLTPLGCWNSCSNPIFQKCPTKFPIILKPEFCAYTRDGNYVNETFECQACQRKNTLGVTKGACSCNFIKCKKGEDCSNGKCKPIKGYCDENAICKKGFSCVKNFCFWDTAKNSNKISKN